MKKILAILLAAAITFSFSACGGNNVVSSADDQSQTDESTSGEDKTSSDDEQTSGDAEESSDSESESPEDLAGLLANAPVGGQYIIGYADSHQNDWLKGWTSNASQVNVRTMLGQDQYYDIYVMTREGTFIVNEVVVKELKEEEHEDNSKTWTVTLCDDLVWSDGTPITAKDYITNIVLRSCPQFAELSGDNTVGVDIVGFDEFNSGATKTFAGVHLIDDYTFSITMKGENRPYHWEFDVVNYGPLPAAVIAPGVEFTDSPEGLVVPDAFNTELLRKTLLDENTGYRYHPVPSCGPYTFDSFDAGANQVTLLRNDKFKGTYDGVKPHIEKVIFKTISPDTMMDQLRSGAVDAIYGQSNKERIETGLNMEEEGLIYTKSYYQPGYNNWKLQCDFGPTQFKAVRQALAYLMNRDESLQQSVGSYGKVIDGYFSLNQYEYLERGEELEAKLIHYTFNPDKAKELLIADGWTKNATGGDFVEGTDEIRYKDVDGTLMPLEIQFLGQAGKGLDLDNTMIPPEAAKVGMKLTIAPMDWAAMMEQVQRTSGSELQYHGFSMGIGFDTRPAPWYEYSTEPGYIGLWNLNYIDSPEIKEAANKMKSIPLEDKESWMNAWEDFQVVWNDQLPDIPTSSNMQFAFINKKAKNADPTGTWQYKYDVPYMYIEE